MPVVAQSQSDRGAVVLRRRPDDGALELRVNGIFVMDDREASTEVLLARTTLDALPPDLGRGWRVLVGGLGLGFTLAEVIADARVGHVVVAEIEPELVRWHREGLVPSSPLVETHSGGRVRVEIGDVRDVVAGLEASSTDLILLDVDNGPDFLVYADNAAVYESGFLGRCRDALSAYGVMAVWSADTSAALTAALDEVFGSSRELAVPVTLQSRLTTYHLFLAPWTGRGEAPRTGATSPAS